MPARIPANLPPLRTKIRRSFSLLTILYALLGTFMMASVFLAIGVTPKAIHMNYDSIESAVLMGQSWDALKTPEAYPKRTPKEWADQFENALKLEEGNITEPGEDELAKGTRALWDRSKTDLAKVTIPDSRRMHELLSGIISVNQKGMFRLAEDNERFGRTVFLGAIIFFVITLLLSYILGDSLANRLARPLKDMAEELRVGLTIDKKLRLPEPESLEMRILTNELLSLWRRLAEFRKVNVEELSAQTERLGTVLASVEDAILVLDNDGMVLHGSEGMLKLLNLALSDVVGQAWVDLPTGAENYLKLRGLLRADMVGDNAVELTVGGKRMVYAGRHRNILTVNGANSGQLYLLHDITEMRHRERLKAEFIGVLSHELKTPRQSLGTAAELLGNRKDQYGDDMKMLVETINEDVSRIRAVANDFMQVGLADHHSLKLKLERTPLNQLLQEWIKPFKVLARDKNASVEFEQDGSAPVWANIDIVKLPWAISNLLANAVRVSQPGQKVIVRLNDRVSTEYFQIDIVDEGPGIPEDVQKRMFEPYFQAPQGTMGASTGFLGLGLTIAKEVIEAHEGKIEYFGNRPRGSVFRIKLPSIPMYS